MFKAVLLFSLCLFVFSYETRIKVVPKNQWKLCMSNPPFEPVSIELDPPKPSPNVLLTTTVKGIGSKFKFLLIF